MHAVRIDTRQIQTAGRRSFWDAHVGRLLACHSRTQPLGQQSLEATMEWREVGTLVIATVSGSPQQLNLQPSSRTDLLLIIPQSTGGWIGGQEASAPLVVDAMVLVDPQQAQQFHVPVPFTHTGVVLPAALAEAGRRFLAQRPCAALPSRGAGLVFADLVRSAYVRAPALDAVAAGAVVRALVDVLAAALGESLGGNGDARAPARLQAFHLRRIREHVLRQLGNADLNVAAVASALNLSVRYLHRLFSGDGTPLMKWIWNERVDRCRSDLLAAAGSGRRLGDVGFDWGFSTHTHFSRAFRRRHGVTPSQFVQQAAAR